MRDELCEENRGFCIHPRVFMFIPLGVKNVRRKTEEGFSCHPSSFIPPQSDEHEEEKREEGFFIVSSLIPHSWL